jgi:hypothetical protein
MSNPKQTCETCKHYTCFDGDDYHQGIYQAVFRNGCEIHEEARYRYWEDKCEQWEGQDNAE